MTTPATPVAWTPAGEYRDIRYEHSGTGIARVTINRPEVRNAFRPETVGELIDAFARIRDDPSVGCVLLTGEGDKAFCSGGDQRYKSHAGGYVGRTASAPPHIVLDLQRQIRSLPIPVIAQVNGYAIAAATSSTSSATSRSPARTPSSASRPAGRELRRRLRDRAPGRPRRRQEGQGDLVPVPPVHGRRGTRDGPRQSGRAARGSEAEGVAWAEEILRMSPTAIRFLKSPSSSPPTGWPGSRSSPATPPASTTPPTRPTRAPGPSSSAGSPTSPSSPVARDGRSRAGARDEVGVPDLAPRHPPRDPAGGRLRGGRRPGRRPRRRGPVPDRHGGGMPGRRPPPAGVGEPGQRPVRLPQGRRHARPGRADPSGRRGARLGAPHGGRHRLRDRPRRPRRPVAGHRRRAGPPRPGRDRDRGRPGLHRRPLSVRLPRPRRGLRLPLLRAPGRRRDGLPPGPPPRAALRRRGDPGGALISAILVVNNLRDIPTDAAAGKRTLGAPGATPDRAGVRHPARPAYAFAVLAAPLGLGVRWGPLAPFVALPLLTLPMAVPRCGPCEASSSHASSSSAQRDGPPGLAFAILFAAGMALAGSPSGPAG